ncbi:ABC transporter substrate-binding protein [Pseudofrankia sp. BMG5.37]|uniref:ABC transporter substrate-binding protein n=1 Tax=Pseudofrankia sp. BMG5.37 TaxID=3050035 RepID=UPI002894F3E2|nr:ABC transporter substrate-binding protein [Pseudofrankia sp. BMG5.37]MDT3440209.1 ABC transporter substrate-binding protein [Pseudofrankia sp. BMG5.37]
MSASHSTAGTTLSRRYGPISSPPPSRKSPSPTSYSVVSEGSITTYGQFVAARGGRRAAIVEDPNSAATRSYSDGMVRSLTAAGVQVVARIAYTAGQSPAAQTAANIAASRADAVIGQVAPDSLREIIAATRQAGLGFKVVLSGAVYDRELLDVPINMLYSAGLPVRRIHPRLFQAIHGTGRHLGRFAATNDQAASRIIGRVRWWRPLPLFSRRDYGLTVAGCGETLGCWWTAR